jgi:hypothetical protein
MTAFNVRKGQPREAADARRAAFFCAISYT